MLELNADAAAPTDLIKDGTDASFAADVIEASQTVPVIVDFWAQWCGPCKMMAPIITELQKEYKGRAAIIFIDVWEHRDPFGASAKSKEALDSFLGSEGDS